MFINEYDHNDTDAKITHKVFKLIGEIIRISAKNPKPNLDGMFTRPFKLNLILKFLHKN